MQYTDINKLINICQKRQEKKKDNVILVCGYEGVGKTTFSKHFYENYLKQTNTLERIQAKFFCIPLKDFAKSLFTCEKKDIVVWDEAGDASGKDAMTTLNKKLVKLYKKIRAKQLVTIFNLPDFFDIDRYFRLHRITLLIFVFKTGKYYVFNKKMIREIVKTGEKTKTIDPKLVRPNAIGYFKDYTGNLFPEYDEQKDTVIDDEAKEFMEFFENEESEEKVFNQSQFAKYIGVSKMTAAKYAKEVPHEVTIAGQLRFKKSVVDEWLNKQPRQTRKNIQNIADMPVSHIQHAVVTTNNPKVNL